MQDYRNFSLNTNFSDIATNYLRRDRQRQQIQQRSGNARSKSIMPTGITNKNHVYHMLLSLLRNKQVLNTECSKIIHFLLHAETKRILRERFGWSKADIRQIENSIIRNVEGMEIVLDAPRTLYNQLKKVNLTDFFFKSGAVAVPGRVLNALICQELLETFTENELLSVPGFIKIYDLDEQGKRVASLRLDLDAKLARQGFLIPVMQNGLIISLKVFRRPNDENPFILRSRNLNTGGQNTW